jgi:hypothetical protein
MRNRKTPQKEDQTGLRQIRGRLMKENVSSTIGGPIRQWLLEAGSAQVVRNTDQVFLRIFYTLIVTERPNLTFSTSSAIKPNCGRPLTFVL